MARKSTIRLLLINESDNESARLISLFRNAGRVARAERPSSLEALHNLLEQEQWDLIIADDKHQEITIEQALEQLKKCKVELPFIAVRDTDAIALLEAGASSVLNSGDDQRLVLTAFHELKHLSTARELSQVKEQLADAEERSQLLMAQSQDAIAYVADGMLISCNQLFAERFGYQQPDDLDCVPVIDLIDENDHEKFKGLLKAQLGLSNSSTDFNFTGLSHSGDSFPASMQLSNAVLDDEPCVQLSVRDPGSSGSSSGGGNTDRDYLTDLYSPSYLLSQLDTAIKQASAGLSNAALLFIHIDKYAELRSRFGIHCMTEVTQQLATQLQAEADAKDCLARYGDDSFVLLTEQAEQAEAIAQSLCASIQQLEIHIGEQILHRTAHIGIVMVDGQRSASATQLLDDSFTAAEQARRESKTGGIALFVPAKERKSVADATSDNELDKILEEAIEDGHFVLEFQPVVSLRGTRGDHYEVMSRFLSDDGPAIDAIEHLRSMHFGEANTRLDRWIILEASKQLAAQIDAGHDTRLFINLSAHTLRDDSLLPWLGVALKAGGIPAEAITLQFLEADLQESMKSAKAFASALKELGCKISISNFGASDHPADLLKQLSGNFTKIAKKHTQEMLNGGDNQTIKQLVAAVNEQGSQAIISGVENAAALAQLWQLGVDYIQGHYLAGPSRKMDYEFTDIA